MTSENVIATLSEDAALLADVTARMAEGGTLGTLVPGEAAAAKAQVVILDTRGRAEADVVRLLKAYVDRAIVLTDHDDKDNINNLLALYPIAHLIGTNGRAVARELAISIRKQTTGNIWGLAQYFDAPVNLESRTIDSADKINEAIDAMLDKADLKASFSATHEFLRMTANELATNAVYNAPVDENNAPKYEQTDRRVKVKLLPTETVDIAVCSDADYVGIAVTDQFGRLDRDKIVRHLVKCVNNTKFIENKKGGAGAGVYLAFYTASQFVINIELGRKLEAICILEKNKRYKTYRSRVTSFNYFVNKMARKMEGAA